MLRSSVCSQFGTTQQAESQQRRVRLWQRRSQSNASQVLWRSPTTNSRWNMILVSPEIKSSESVMFRFVGATLPSSQHRAHLQKWPSFCLLLALPDTNEEAREVGWPLKRLGMNAAGKVGRTQPQAKAGAADGGAEAFTVSQTSPHNFHTEQICLLLGRRSA